MHTQPSVQGTPLDEARDASLSVDVDPSTGNTNKLLAASLGALLTGLTMTPFDVIKTRLQTQNPSEQLFIPSNHLHQPLHSSSSLPSSSIFSASPPTRTLSSATCCQPTYFNTNSGALLCRFDPRIPSQTLATSSLSLTTYPSSNASSSTTYSHNPPSKLTTPISRLSSAVASDCEFPSKSVAASKLSEASPRFTGFWDAVIKIVSREGVGTLWRGVGPTLAISVPSQVGYMIGYDNFRRKLLSFAPQTVQEDGSSSISTVYITASTLIAGGTTRAAIVSFFSPVELLRTRIQSIPASPQNTLLTVLKSTWEVTRSQGYRSLWRGLPPTLWRDVPFSGIYWASYEMVKRSIVGRGMGEISREGEQETKSKTFTVAFISGVVGSSIAAAITHPFDVIKTRRQATITHRQNTSTVALIRETIAREGAQSLFAGLTPRLAKVMPACGIMIGVYELALK